MLITEWRKVATRGDEASGYGFVCYTTNAAEHPRGGWLHPRRVRTGCGYHPNAVKLQEFHSKSLLRRAGLPVPPWSVASTPAEARAEAEAYLREGADKVVIK